MRTVRLFSFIFILLIIFLESVSAFEVQGLKTPESFIADPSTGNYFISNINGGGPGGKDDDGFITKLDKDGKVINLAFVDGKNKDKYKTPQIIKVEQMIEQAKAENADEKVVALEKINAVLAKLNEADLNSLVNSS